MVNSASPLNAGVSNVACLACVALATATAVTARAVGDKAASGVMLAVGIDVLEGISAVEETSVSSTAVPVTGRKADAVTGSTVVSQSAAEGAQELSIRIPTANEAALVLPGNRLE